jgi:ElaB/YqjD/DUF883 family membrane-anchored ribosome-binding protein
MTNQGNPSQGMQQKVENTASRIAGEAKEKAQELADKARSTASAVADKARDAASTVKDRADDAISSVGQKMSSLAGSLREKAPQQGMLGNAASTGADYLQAGGRYLQEHGVDDMGRDVTQLVRQHPMQALLLSFGVGCLLGMSLRR